MDDQVGKLKRQVAELRAQLFETTEAYRSSLAHHTPEETIRLLHSRSQLMRQLLERQCELLLSLRNEGPKTPAAISSQTSSSPGAIQD
jgi:hypothetical protein